MNGEFKVVITRSVQIGLNRLFLPRLRPVHIEIYNQDGLRVNEGYVFGMLVGFNFRLRRRVKWLLAQARIMAAHSVG